MKDWLKQNGWALGLVVAALISNYALVGFRIDALEKHQADQDQQIAQLTSGNVTTQISLAQIQTKLEYITLQLNKLVP